MRVINQKPVFFGAFRYSMVAVRLLPVLGTTKAKIFGGDGTLNSSFPHFQLASLSSDIEIH